MQTSGGGNPIGANILNASLVSANFSNTDVTGIIYNQKTKFHGILANKLARRA